MIRRSLFLGIGLCAVVLAVAFVQVRRRPPGEAAVSPRASTDASLRATLPDKLQGPEVDCNHLANFLIRSAEASLARSRTLVASGAVMDHTGTVSRVDVGVGSYDASRLDAVEQVIREGAKRGIYKAAAVVSDLRLKPSSSGIVGGAIAVDVDHRDGYSARFLTPYTFGKDGKFGSAPPFPTASQKHFFQPPAPDR